MSVPKVVVFDLGKVLVNFDYGIAARNIAAHSSLDETAVRKLIDLSPLLFRYETGLMTRQEFYHAVSAGTGYRGAPDEFSAHFADIFWEIDPMIVLHDTLRANNVPTYIFSNTNDIAVGHIRERFPFFSRFDDYILSYEHGVMKPDPRLYEVVEQRAGQKGGAIVYLDDRAENIATAKTRGWHAILHETPAATFSALQNLGLPIPVQK